MFRILVVEDALDIRERLVNKIISDIDQVWVDQAATVKSGQEYLDAVKQFQRPYDAVVLDFELPPDDQPFAILSINESLCQSIRDERTFVLHVTSHYSHPTVREHMARQHDRPLVPAGHLIQKGGDYDLNVVKALRHYLYDRKVNEDLDRIVGNPNRSRETVGFSALDPEPGEAGLSYHLMSVTENATRYWKELDETTRQRLRQTFHVLETSGGVRLHLSEPSEHNDRSQS